MKYHQNLSNLFSLSSLINTVELSRPLIEISEFKVNRKIPSFGLVENFAAVLAGVFIVPIKFNIGRIRLATAIMMMVVLVVPLLRKTTRISSPVR